MPDLIHPEPADTPSSVSPSPPRPRATDKTFKIFGSTLSASGTPLTTSPSHQRYLSTLDRDLILPRSSWPSHPRYPSNVLLLRGHASFRATSKEIWTGLMTMDHVTFKSRETGLGPRVYRRMFESWHANMGGHERYEETKLYPYLCRRFGVDTEWLRREHEELHAARDAVLVAFKQYENLEVTPLANTAEKMGGNLFEAMDAYDKLLTVHLMEEEELVIPLLLALSTEEFEFYCDHGLTEVLRALDLKDKEDGVRRKTCRK
ncbi:hypothetical protein HK101_010403 [Irineochytrium annulatum]|nr:hypothetical protein HK101_010403 [Irineochytrium annulatum]